MLGSIPRISMVLSLSFLPFHLYSSINQIQFCDECQINSMKAEKAQLSISENQLYSSNIKSFRMLIFTAFEDTRGYTDLQNLKLHS